MSADAMEFMVTFFPTQQAFSKTEQKITMPALAERIRWEYAPTKAELPWCKLGFFGDKRTDNNCLRSNANLRWVSGVEFDYDREKISFDEAVDILAAAGVMSIVYTTASHTKAKPRWRVLCPFTLGQQCDQRNKFLARLNGLFGAAVSNESWTFSQAFYYGSVGDTATHIVEEIYGFCIDQLNDLDATAIGKSSGTRTPGNDNAGTEASDDAIADAELFRSILTSDVLHPALCAAAARYVARGYRPPDVIGLLQSLMLVTVEHDRDERWHHRFGQIPGLVDSAMIKYADGRAEACTAVARRVHRARRQLLEFADIRATVLAEAEHLGLSRETALAIMRRILATELEAVHAS